MKNLLPNPSSSRRVVALAVLAFGILIALPWQVAARGPVASNLIKNGGFEEGSDGFSNWQQGVIGNSPANVSTSVDNSTAHIGKASLKFEKSESSFFPVKTVMQDIPFDGAQKRLMVGVWVKAQKARKATMAVIFGGGDGSIEWGAYVGEQHEGQGPADHDWQHYGAVVAIPSGTTGITIALEMYGPGTVWMDDVTAEFVPESTPLQSARSDSGGEDPLVDLKDVPNLDLRAGHDPYKRYFLIGAKPGSEPVGGYKVVVVLPGGDGSADFNPFVRRVWKNALDKDTVVAELVAAKWSDEQATQLVWPTKRNQWKGMLFSTEEFVASVVADVKRQVKVNDRMVYSLSWSSGGPAAYATALGDGPIKGSFVAMSIYKPSDLPPLAMAKGQAFYILHSPEDALIPISMPTRAVAELEKAGARTTLETYSGGHGWHGDAFGMISKGIKWLESGG